MLIGWKHAKCFYWVLTTRLEIWENDKSCGNTSRRQVFPQRFRVLPNFHDCFYNSIYSCHGKFGKTQRRCLRLVFPQQFLVLPNSVPIVFLKLDRNTVHVFWFLNNSWTRKKVGREIQICDKMHDRKQSVFFSVGDQRKEIGVKAASH